MATQAGQALFPICCCSQSAPNSTCLFQPLFDTLESHVKAFRLRKAGARPTGAITDDEKLPTGRAGC